MIYASGQDWRTAKHKRIVLFAMSGLGKTHLSNMLRDTGAWFHYSIDYRIGTRYMGEYIADNAKREAMKVPFLRELLMSDSIYIGSNLTFDNLAPVSAYLGKPGNTSQGGVPIEEYRKRQDQFQRAEMAALLDTGYFIDRALDLYGYPNFVCDTGGSICEWVDPDDPNDPILTALSERALLVWLEGDDAHTQELIKRFDKAPKPMAYQPEFLTRVWTEYLHKNKVQPDDVDPNDFIRWTYAQALAHRRPRYKAMADNWGITLNAQALAGATDAHTFDALIADALDEKTR